MSPSLCYSACCQEIIVYHRGGLYWSRFFWAMSPTSLFSFPQERLITDMLMMSAWWREPSNISPHLPGRKSLHQSYPAFKPFTCLPAGEAHVALCHLPVVAGPGQAGAVQNRKAAAALPILRRTLDFDLYFISGIITSTDRTRVRERK